MFVRSVLSWRLEGDRAALCKGPTCLLELCHYSRDSFAEITSLRSLMLYKNWLTAGAEQDLQDSSSPQASLVSRKSSRGCTVRQSAPLRCIIFMNPLCIQEWDFLIITNNPPEITSQTILMIINTHSIIYDNTLLVTTQIGIFERPSLWPLIIFISNRKWNKPQFDFIQFRLRRLTQCFCSRQDVETNNS